LSDWVAVSDKEGMVVGFVRSDELYPSAAPPPGQVLPPLTIFGNSGEEIGKFGADGFPEIRP
jgi:hypothetical protein